MNLDELMERTWRYGQAYFLGEVLKGFVEQPVGFFEKYMTSDNMKILTAAKERLPELKDPDCFLWQTYHGLADCLFDSIDKENSGGRYNSLFSAVNHEVERIPFLLFLRQEDFMVQYLFSALEQTPFYGAFSDLSEDLFEPLSQHRISQGLEDNVLLANFFLLARRNVDSHMIDQHVKTILKHDEVNSWNELHSCLEITSREEIIGVLGSGLNATTYLAYSPSFKKRVAIKVTDTDSEVDAFVKTLSELPPKDFDFGPMTLFDYLFRGIYAPQDSEDKFFQTQKKKKSYNNEIQTLTELHHENIVHIYYAGDHFVKKNARPVHAIMMEYVDGPTIDDLFTERPEDLDDATIWDYGLQMLEGIGYLMKKEVFHKDLHPKNVAINSKGVLKIMDFGTAGAPGEPIVSNRRYGGQNDLFSWGLLMYQLFTGEHLIAQRTPGETTEMYASRIEEYKQELWTESGEIRSEYKTKISDTLPFLFAGPIIDSLEMTSAEKFREIKNATEYLYQATKERKEGKRR